MRPYIFKEMKSFKLFEQTQPTRSCRDVPLLYCEPGILDGYRPPGHSWMYYAFSAFQRHNETINIWTHALAAIIYIQKIANIVQTTENDCETLPLVAFGFCAAANSLLSATAHTFHSKSAFCHYVGFQLDYAGIGLYAFGQCVLFLGISCPDHIYDKIGWISLPVNVFLSWVVMLGGCLPKLLYRRPYPFTRRLIQIGSGCIPAIFGSIPLLSRCTFCILDRDCRIISGGHHLLWVVTMVISLFLLFSHLPEKNYPGKFNYTGHSHQLFHVFQIITVLLQFHSAYTDASNKAQTLWSCHQISLFELILSVIVYSAGCLVIIALLVKSVRKRIEEDKKSA